MTDGIYPSDEVLNKIKPSEFARLIVEILHGEGQVFRQQAIVQMYLDVLSSVDSPDWLIAFVDGKYYRVKSE